MGRIFAAGLHVGEGQHGGHHIVGGLGVQGVAGLGVDHSKEGHAADLVLGVNLVTQQHRFGAGYKLVMGRLVDHLHPVFVRANVQTRRVPRAELDGVDLVEGHPVFDLTLVFVEDDPAIVLEEIH